MRLACAVVLLAFARTAAAQTPAPEAKQSTDAPTKPRPALKLNLDQVDAPSHPATVTFDKPAEKKQAPQKAGGDLPGLGGPMTNQWERPSSQVFPPDSTAPKMPGDQYR